MEKIIDDWSHLRVEEALNECKQEKNQLKEQLENCLAEKKQLQKQIQVNQEKLDECKPPIESEDTRISITLKNKNSHHLRGVAINSPSLKIKTIIEEDENDNTTQFTPEEFKQLPRALKAKHSLCVNAIFNKQKAGKDNWCMQFSYDDNVKEILGLNETLINEN